MITTLLFDLDDTLLDFKESEAKALSQTLRQLEIPPTPETVSRYSAINMRQWELLEEGKLTRTQVLHRRFDLLFAELGVQRSSHQAQDLYEHLLAQGYDLIPGARELMELLQPSYRLFLVSNGTAFVQDSRLAATGFGRYFEDIFISERVGADKPSRAFFDFCFAHMPGATREATLIIGDSLTSDMRGGIDAGIHTCWFNPRKASPREDILPDYEIHGLAELPPLLRLLAQKEAVSK